MIEMILNRPFQSFFYLYLFGINQSQVIGRKLTTLTITIETILIQHMPNHSPLYMHIILL